MFDSAIDEIEACVLENEVMICARFISWIGSDPPPAGRGIPSGWLGKTIPWDYAVPYLEDWRFGTGNPTEREHTGYYDLIAWSNMTVYTVDSHGLDPMLIAIPRNPLFENDEVLIDVWSEMGVHSLDMNGDVIIQESGDTPPQRSAIAQWVTGLMLNMLESGVSRWQFTLRMGLAPYDDRPDTLFFKEKT